MDLCPGIQGQQQGTVLLTGVKGIQIIVVIGFLHDDLRMRQPEDILKVVQPLRLAALDLNQPLPVQVLDREYFFCRQPMTFRYGHTEMIVALGQDSLGVKSTHQQIKLLTQCGDDGETFLLGVSVGHNMKLILGIGSTERPPQVGQCLTWVQKGRAHPNDNSLLLLRTFGSGFRIFGQRRHFLSVLHQ